MTKTEAITSLTMDQRVAKLEANFSDFLRQQIDLGIHNRDLTVNINHKQIPFLVDFKAVFKRLQPFYFNERSVFLDWGVHNIGICIEIYYPEDPYSMYTSSLEEVLTDPDYISNYEAMLKFFDGCDSDVDPKMDFSLPIEPTPGCIRPYLYFSICTEIKRRYNKTLVMDDIESWRLV